MAKEPSSNSNNTTSPSSSASAESFIGSFISVTSKSEIRYEGVLYHLNPQDASFGLKNVRAYGTEGRRKDGQEVPPSDKFYEYILFRGSDIKDLRVITNPPVQKEELVYNDPAIIQSNYHEATSSSSKSTAAIGGSLGESRLYSEPSALNPIGYPSKPSHLSGPEYGIWASSQSMKTAESSYGMPTQWQGYSGSPGNTVVQHSVLSTPSLYPFQNQTPTTMEAPGNTFVAQQHSVLSTPSLYPFQNQTPTTMEVPNISQNVQPASTLNATHSLTSERLSMPFINSLSSKPSQTFHHSTLINSNGLSLPFSLPYQNASNIEAQVVNKVVPDPISLPAQLLPYSTLSISAPISDSTLRQQPALLIPNLSESRLSEHSLSKNLYPAHKDMDSMSSTSLLFTSSATTLAAQPPLLPLPPASQKLQSPLEFTEEFDFQAMNEKFKKDEVWGYLGKANQGERVEGMQNATSSRDLGNNNPPDLIPKNDPMPAYNKDDFFDNISRHSLGHGTRDGHNQFSQRMKLDSETFGNFQRRTQFGYGGHRGGHGQHRGPSNWGRGYNYGNRGRGRYY